MKNLTLKSALLLINVLFLGFVASAQGSIEGVVKDSTNQENLPFASIALMLDDEMVSSTTTDYEGFFFIDNVEKGNYSLVVNYAGKTKTFTEVRMLKNTLSYTLEIDPANVLDDITVTSYVNLISTEDIELYDDEFLDNIGAVNITDIESIGVSQVETPDGISYKGARPGTGVYYIDGMRTYGDLFIPMSAVDNVTVYNSGIPAMYGNTTSAVIVVETKSFTDY